MKIKMLAFIGCILLLSFYCAPSQAFELDNDLSALGNLLNGNYHAAKSHHQIILMKKRSEGNQNSVGSNLPPGYIELSIHNGLITGYKLNRTKVSWNAARRACHEEGAYLGYPVSAKEGKKYHHLLKHANNGGAWIGLHDLFEEGEWITVLGKKVNDLKYINWAITEPNNYGHGEDCAEIYDKNGQWYDTECDKKLSFFCKIVIRRD